MASYRSRKDSFGRSIVKVDTCRRGEDSQCFAAIIVDPVVGRSVALTFEAGHGHAGMNAAASATAAKAAEAAAIAVGSVAVTSNNCDCRGLSPTLGGMQRP